MTILQELRRQLSHPSRVYYHSLHNIENIKDLKLRADKSKISKMIGCQNRESPALQVKIPETVTDRLTALSHSTID